MPEDGILVADGGFAGALGRAALRHQAGRTRHSCPTAALPRSATACRAPWARRWRRQRPAGAVADGRRRVQHDAGRTGDARGAWGSAFAIVVFNNAASGYVKALQHLMYGAGNYQSSDLAEIDYAGMARGDGLQRHPRRGAGQARPARSARDWRPTAGPTVIDVVVTRDPAKMLPAVDNRTVEAKKGDRVA